MLCFFLSIQKLSFLSCIHWPGSGSRCGSSSKVSQVSQVPSFGSGRNIEEIGGGVLKPQKSIPNQCVASYMPNKLKEFPLRKSANNYVVITRISSGFCEFFENLTYLGFFLATSSIPTSTMTSKTSVNVMKQQYARNSNNNNNNTDSLQTNKRVSQSKDKFDHDGIT